MELAALGGDNKNKDLCSVNNKYFDNFVEQKRLKKLINFVLKITKKMFSSKTGV